MFSSPFHRYRIIGSLTDLPIEKGCLYAFDLDDTIIFEKGNRGAKSYRDFEYMVDPKDLEHLWKINDVSKIIYITARNPDDKDFTLEQFKKFGIPMGDIYFTIYKYNSMADYLSGKRFKRIYFVDDLASNCQLMAEHLPQITVCQIDKVLYEKLNFR